MYSRMCLSMQKVSIQYVAYLFQKRNIPSIVRVSNDRAIFWSQFLQKIVAANFVVDAPVEAIGRPVLQHSSALYALAMGLREQSRENRHQGRHGSVFTFLICCVSKSNERQRRFKTRSYNLWNRSHWNCLCGWYSPVHLYWWPQPSLWKTSTIRKTTSRNRNRYR